ncbi:hypothetical protein MIR68_003476 [Amoeboaphelidium protococcarum]|nr:hypothetical protein MIR68_003476 [Amoeboaphelidium protococcarum]
MKVLLLGTLLFVLPITAQDGPTYTDVTDGGYIGIDPIYGDYDDGKKVDKKKDYEKDYGKKDYEKDYGMKDYEKDYGIKDYEKHDFEKKDNGKKDYEKEDYEKKDYEKEDYGKKDYEKKEDYEVNGRSGYSFPYPPFIGKFTPAACPNLKRCRNPQIRNLTPFGRPTFVQAGPSGLICIYGSNASACQFDASSQFCAFLTLNKYFGPNRVVTGPTGQAIILGC